MITKPNSYGTPHVEIGKEYKTKEGKTVKCERFGFLDQDGQEWYWFSDGMSRRADGKYVDECNLPVNALDIDLTAGL